MHRNGWANVHIKSCKYWENRSNLVLEWIDRISAVDGRRSDIDKHVIWVVLLMLVDASGKLKRKVSLDTPTMFAATTTDTLSISDPAALKKAPSSIPSCLDLIHPPTASSWSPDNAFLYISSEHIIHRYEPTSNVLKDIYVHDLKPVSHLVAKDRSNVIFSSEEMIHVLECEASPRISQTFESQKSPVNSLSLSNDNTLLSSTTIGSVHVHNLALGSHTVLRGLPTQAIMTATFHPHSRTRLLVAAGKQLMVYDTTRPSSPSKVITMTESASGDIVTVACSPFSKTLVAVATSTGFIGLIDLEKEKA